MNNSEKFLRYKPFHSYDETALKNKHLVITEKLDGVGVSLFFLKNGKPVFNLINSKIPQQQKNKLLFRFKRWLSVNEKSILKLIGTKYIIFGELMDYKNSIYYDALPDFFFEFDVLDIDSEIFLTSLERKRMFEGTIIKSVPIIWNGSDLNIQNIPYLLGNSLFKTNHWKQTLNNKISGVQDDLKEKIWINTDSSMLMEGLCIKVEDDKVSLGLKCIRRDFIKGTHSNNLPLIKNLIIEK